MTQPIITSNNGKLSLSPGVDAKAIKTNGLLVITTIQKGRELISEHMTAVMLHYLGQEQVVKHNKGDTSLITSFMYSLYELNPSFFRASVKALSDIIGLSVKAEPVEGSETEYTVTAEVKSGDRAKVLSEAPAKLVSMFNQGMFSPELSYHKMSLPKGKGSGKGKDASPSAVTTPIPESVAVAVAQVSDTEAGKKVLDANAELIAEIIALGAKTDPTRYRELLESTRNKLRGQIMVPETKVA